VVITIATLLLAFVAAETGPIAASIERHAADGVWDTSATHDDRWTRVKRIAPGTDLVIATASSDGLTRVFVSADDDGMTVLNLATNPPCRSAKGLLDVARMRPELFEPARLAVGFIAGDVDVRADRILVTGNWDCATSSVVERIPRASVRIVKSPRTVQSSTAWTVAGASLGFIIGGYMAVAAALSCDNGQVSSVCTTVPGVIELAAPVAGGLIGHHTTKHVVEDVYYCRD